MARAEKTEKAMEERKKIIEEQMKKHGGVMKTKQLYEECGLSYQELDVLYKEEYLARVKNGYYRIKNEEKKEEEYITALFSDGVLCMESALYYHGYISKKPFSWSIAIDKNTSKSRFLLDYPVVVPYYTEPRVLEIGVEEIEIEGRKMKIYDRDRLICDVLKYEHKIEREVFKEGILSYIKDDKKDIHKLLEYAKERKVATKVQNVIGVWL